MTDPGEQVLRALTLAAKKGSESADFLLGRIFDEEWGVDANEATAFQHYKRASLAGLREAYYFLGSCCLFGKGTKPDDKEAIKWITKAAIERDLDAEYMLAVCISEGRGIAANPARGRRMMRRLAEAGHRHSIDYLSAQPNSRRSTRHSAAQTKRNSRRQRS